MELDSVLPRVMKKLGQLFGVHVTPQNATTQSMSKCFLQSWGKEFKVFQVTRTANLNGKSKEKLDKGSAMAGRQSKSLGFIYVQIWKTKYQYTSKYFTNI